MKLGIIVWSDGQLKNYCLTLAGKADKRLLIDEAIELIRLAASDTSASDFVPVT